MAVVELEQGVEIWGDVAEMLNDIHNADGKIDKDDKRIWGPYLHTWTNEQ